MMATKLPITVTFETEDHELAHTMIGALLDMTLTSYGATIDQLETAFVALGEIIDTIAAAGTVRVVELHHQPEGPILSIHHSSASLAFAPGSRDIIDAAFPTFRQAAGIIRLSMIHHFDRIDNDQAEPSRTRHPRPGRLPAMNADVTIRVPADNRAIPTIRHMLRCALPQLDTDDSALYFGAVTEILANAIAAHHQKPATPIDVSLSLGARPGVTITDTGPGFDTHAPPGSSGSGGRGNGLVIARSACPDMTIESSPAGTIVHLPFGPPAEC